ncbi:MAG: cysteine dioxygenase family protein [Planctomycetota bacterium]
MVQQLREHMLKGPGGVERPFSADEMRAAAESVDLASLDLGSHVQWNEERYARNTVFENEHFELVVICWRPGQASAVHDHGESLCLYLVIDGEFEERLFELGADGEPKQNLARRWKTGDITIASGGDVHQIANDTDRDLVTLHVYSPPLAQTSKYFTPVPRTIRA